MRLFVMAFAGVYEKSPVLDFEDKAVLFVDTYAPPPRQIPFQWFGLADAIESVAFNALQKLVDALDRFLVGSLPADICSPGRIIP